EPAAGLHSYGQTLHPPSTFQLSGVPGGFPDGTHRQIQSHQYGHPTVTQMSQMIDSDYTLNAMSTDLPNSLSQLGSNFVSPSIRGSHQPVPFLAVTRAATQQW